MNEVSSIGKFLEPLSEAYAHIPFEGYGIAGILSIVLLAFYGIVISRLKITERRKILVRRVCAWCVIVCIVERFSSVILFMDFCSCRSESFLHGSVLGKR